MASRASAFVLAANTKANLLPKFRRLSASRAVGGTKTLSGGLSGTAAHKESRRHACGDARTRVGRARSFASAAASTSPTENYDVVIAGAGIVGLNSAYQLKRRAPELRVLVLERGRGLAEGSTGNSSACMCPPATHRMFLRPTLTRRNGAVLRTRYSLDPMMQSAVEGLHVYKNWAAYTGLPTHEVAGGYNLIPILWFLGHNKAQTQADVDRMATYDLEATVMSADDIEHRWGGNVSTCNHVFRGSGEGMEDHECGRGGVEDEHFLCEEATGYFEPTNALVDLAAALKRQGVEIRMRSGVASVSQEGGRATGVTLTDGTHIAAGKVVNAAGPWCNAITESTGLQLPFTLLPTRIQVVYKEAPELVGPAGASIPGIADTRAGIYMRPQLKSGQILVSTVREEEEQEHVDPSDYNTSADPEFRQNLLNSLHHRIPTLEPRGRVMSFAAMYTICKEDVHPICGETELGGYYVANGFSGHGFKCSPAIGSLMAQILTDTVGQGDEFDSKVDPAFFSPYRQPHVVAGGLNVLA